MTNNENTLRVFRIRNKITLEMVKGLMPSLIVSFNYRHRIPKDVLDYMGDRVINLHTSLLPYNRGSSPNFFSFLEDTPKGVTIHLVDENLDTGNILIQKELFFDEEKETFASTYARLLEEIKTLFKDNWPAIKAGSITPVRQTGQGSVHRMKELDEIRRETPFDWDTVIADFKRLRSR